MRCMWRCLWRCLWRVCGRWEDTTDGGAADSDTVEAGATDIGEHAAADPATSDEHDEEAWQPLPKATKELVPQMAVSKVPQMVVSKVGWLLISKEVSDFCFCVCLMLFCVFFFRTISFDTSKPK